MKLTNQLRDELCRALLTHVFKNRIEGLIAIHKQFVARVYDDIFTEAERKLMSSLPEGWLRTDDDFKVVFGSSENYGILNNNGTFHTDHLQCVSYNKPERLFRRFPYNSNAYKIYETVDPLAQEYFHFAAEKTELGEEIGEKRSQAMGTLHACSTINMLVKAWPEIKPFIPAHCFEKGSTAVALPVDVLNRSFNLPKEAA